MSDMKAKMASVQKLLASGILDGKLSEMLSSGLPHALDGRPDDRHPMQLAVLTMATQALATAHAEAQATEAACRQKVEAAQAELEGLKAAAASASEELGTAKATAAGQKGLLGEFKRRVTEEENEYKELAANDKEGAKVMAGLEKQKSEIVAFLESTHQKGTLTSRMEEFLHEAKAESVLIAALPGVLGKEPSDRLGFDLVVVSSVQEFFSQKLAEMEAKIAEEVASQADSHAEAVGAFAVMDLCKERCHQAETTLQENNASVEACAEKLQEANTGVQRGERASAKSHGEAASAEKHTGRCSEAVNALSYLESPPAAVAEEPAPAIVAEESAVPDVDMAVPTIAFAQPAASPQRPRVQVAAADVEMSDPYAAA